ncbi:hypothetical protein SERLADRAFT_366315 [Serpula lacrymans var. lacrymans S7.9]|uniref:Uncharacterized protein n=1 Tax=Serpula lacrymans var. lacrymans (strain S7.9) TaxID=578457 RepID=F8NLQ3_SERL9|nr:uncharacterized protein SERLADRAFT_366315 [Serpula lacrymans var. lacrymans S7.9]EGO28605.1 hypothetical protein SERLADRAFT_366315 [Serpula lacrymans var. lacrymans S7.9]
MSGSTSTVRNTTNVGNLETFFNIYARNQTSVNPLLELRRIHPYHPGGSTQHLFTTDTASMPNVMISNSHVT